MKLLVLAVAIAVLCAAPTGAAWTIASSPTSSMPTDETDNASLAKTWTITGAGALETLVVQSMGRVFIDYDASLGDGAVAQVVVRGDNPSLLDAIQVVEQQDASRLEIHFRNDAFEGQGHVLTQVRVATPHVLRNVTMAWSADLIVGHDVLVETNASVNVSLSLVGSGDLYAGSSNTEYRLGSLFVDLAGSGDLQLLAQSLALEDSLDLHLVGSGDMAIVADRISVDATLSSLVAGSGNVFVQSLNLTASSLSSTIAGSGDITYSRNGTCETQDVVVVGSGDVATASIVCRSSFVNLVGSGDILVQTTENLTVASFFVGDVRYFGATPRHITASSLFDNGASSSPSTQKHSKDIVRRAKKNQYNEYETNGAPERKPVYVVVKTSTSVLGDKPHLHYALELETLDEAFVAQFLSQQRAFTTGHLTAETEISWPYGVVIAGIVAVVGAAVAKHMRRRRRHAYHAL